MDQIKIGRFIALRRKAVGLTQLQLAEKLGITDRAVSKWETGKSMPDAAIMLELCAILGIAVGDLLCGEVVGTEEYAKELEKKLLEAIKQKEQADKRLLTLEIAFGLIGVVVLFGLIALAAYVEMPVPLRVGLIAAGMALFLVACFVALRIEQVAGYYECRECGHRYVPTYKAVVNAPHMGRTRRMTCPACRKKSWQKKVLSKETEE